MPDNTPTAAQLVDAYEAQRAAAEQSRSDDPPVAPIIVLLSRVMCDVGAVGKDRTAPAKVGGYRFRGIDAVVNAVSPALRAHGVLVMPTVLEAQHELVEARGGGAMSTVHVRVRYTFYGPAGDSISTEVVAESFDAGDKATAKAMSVALRTALLQALMLPTDDDDPDEANFERAGAREQQPPPQPARQPSPGAQRRAAQTSPAAPTPIPDALADQYRDRIINAVISWPVGADRDTELRGIRDQLATIPGASATLAAVPEPWQQGRGTHAPLGQLVIVARNAGDPTDPTA